MKRNNTVNREPTAQSHCRTSCSSKVNWQN